MRFTYSNKEVEMATTYRRNVGDGLRQVWDNLFRNRKFARALADQLHAERRTPGDGRSARPARSDQRATQDS